MGEAMPYTRVNIEDGEWAISCDDCGAHVLNGTESDVKHYKSCVPGESEKWEKFYAEEGMCDGDDD
jgi:hypothetical protein